ncbi:replication-associated recombination protein A [Brevibacterium luteolum]|uniref:replication-associated recombination protein A n=1 Tax=Brevibacterium luteolum TaxID=199591 RepID=UPI00223B29D7|nr:replication-associated recombination protein A [Brevibacterium luteolum]MCT1921219.1 replication-associated recombination protein A [Brevibacterium luteolum]
MSDLFSSANEAAAGADEAPAAASGTEPAETAAPPNPDDLSGVSALDPLAVRMRPRSIDEIVGQEHLTAPGSPLHQLAEARTGARAGATSVILWGPPGVGKTTIAHVISHSPNRKFVELSAITAGVKDVRQVIENARNDRELYQRTTVLFLDEIHRFSKAQQDALLPAVENRLVVLIAATTENPSFSVIAPLVSRSLVLTLKPLTDEGVAALIDRALESPRGLAGTFTLDDDARDYIVQVASGDGRRALTVLEAAAASARATSGSDETTAITRDQAAESANQAVVRYDRAGDQHYDVTSAFIKSIRGSDPDAALHYLARMIVAGEDPRFIARRIVIAAAEDIGMADPQALPLAVAAQTAVERIGMPEGRIPLAEAVVYLACAPKSNASYAAIDAAIADVKAGKAGEVPLHLRDAHYPGAKALGHGAGYKYAHSYPHSVAAQDHLPESLAEATYYTPTANGAEKGMAERLAAIARLRAGK